MACINPITTKAREGGSKTFPCGHCRECRIQFVKDWSFRLQQELKEAHNAYFITLTYAEEPEGLNKSHIRGFLKDLRNFTSFRMQQADKGKIIALTPNKGQNLRFFCVGEYGDKFGRPHWHMILFNVPLFKTTKVKYTTTHQEIHKMIQDAWIHGMVDIGTVTEASINYVTKYIFKKKTESNRLMSRGLGKCYIENILGYHNTDTGRHFVTREGGIKQHLPKYYSDKIFSDIEKEIHKFNTLSYLAEERKKFNELTTEEKIEEVRKTVIKNDQKDYKQKTSKR